MYNSKDLVVDEDLTFLSYNQTVNAEFTLEEILDSPLWVVNSDNGLIKAIPLFNCDVITSSNESDKVLDDNKCVILENDVDTIVKCISDDTGSMHYHSVELYAYAPYSRLDVISEVTVYCIIHDEYLNTVGNVNVDVYIDDELTTSVVSDSNGVCRFKVDQACTVKFVYGELESNDVVVGGSEVYTLSIETDKQSLFTDESVTIDGVLTMDGEVYADQSIALYDGASLVDTLTTDSNGEYTKTVSGLSVGTHVFRAVHAHVRSSTVSVTVTEPTPVHDYSLSVVSDKDILSYVDGESATLTATLKDNGIVVSGETLSYEIKHGSTVIDSGSDTTDSNGEISFTYSATGVGDVTVEVDYGSLLQETYEVQDYVLYDSTGFSKTTTTSTDTSYPTEYDFALQSINNFQLEFDYNNPTGFRLYFASIKVTNVGDDIQYGIGFTRDNNGRFTFTERTTSTSNTTCQSIPSGTNHYKVVFNGNTVSVWVNDVQQVSNKTLSWWNTHFPYYFNWAIWGIGTGTVSNIKVKAL